ncbi:hypothetical protein GUITHDRAFT_154778 [Guillardia theta CCMP2712]|uniref:Uncharacterized protein n=2 Tax=Guillardia theta TaxID=55529 RepID=L1IQJ4_GUITC|nr:hypothetical protein GUITHDRAFT_154778 [Guillardia theta CCMP2712]EKX38154.1 hypothetical protein GUITHDRAFT_154778 [Guillardia theta CCMP2712]|mmetsp:Transcript_20651/g.69074  ORF Transcript_20651/g.69074 Transcript_20651/m.69074 type:complete len:365 (+) Transcript_20651:13-1107(+)|eukprot:XP_005825134.1 hypothetical protein GUITHDRAFT_154778 [Guillardia theta CCMP2712]
MAVFRVVLLAVTLATVNGFQAYLPSSVPRRAHGRSCFLRSNRRVAVGSLRMGYLDDLDPPKAKTTDGKGNQIMPDMDYKGFIDGEGFDGGDGQVGVVGDGKNAMEEFEDRMVIDNSIGGAGRGKVAGGSSGNRIDKRWNAWGADSTDNSVKDQLKADGMVDIDIFTGEDKKQVQRQQYENWFNQQKQWQAERKLRDQMEALNNGKRQKDTDDYKSLLNKGVTSETLNEDELENVIFATGAKGIDNTEILKKNDWKPVKAGFRIDGEFEIMGQGLATIPVEPNSMVSEQYIARFTEDSAPEFVVAKTGYDLGEREVTGALPRRGNPVEFTVRFNPSGPVAEPKLATLVIDTEDNWKWTFKITGRT